ncbi:hypothetical protein LCGC14_1913790 [marine sediment metagenome]|uniref:DNA polymerase III beta sliding clamp central domain-containing protein n=1 Tax=marine sediment metagenome TaxID=412755 RepID=A0A0F9GG21_9ZZZZ
MLVKGDKKFSRLIRWLQNMASSDAGRPVLNGIHIDGDQTMVTNGYRLVVIDTPKELQNLGPATIEGKVPAGEFESEFTNIEGKYPDFNTIYPNGVAQAVVDVDARLLRELLDGLSGTPSSVSLVLYGPNRPIELFGATRDDRDAYMVLMPMHRALDNKLTRPNGTTVEFVWPEKRIREMEETIERRDEEINELQGQIKELEDNE